MIIILKTRTRTAETLSNLSIAFSCSALGCVLYLGQGLSQEGHERRLERKVGPHDEGSWVMSPL